MIYSGSVIFIEPENLEDAKAVIGLYSEMEIHAVSEDGKQIVVSIETESGDDLEALAARVKSHDCIIDIGHHIMHFEEEVEEILSGDKVPDMRQFQRSARREKHPSEQ